MTMARNYPNRLLVEGDEDKRVIPYFMDHFIHWGDNESEWPVRIEHFGGIENMLKPGTIEAELKSSGLRALGLMVDANDDPMSRWRRIRDRCRKTFDAFPEEIDPSGLILQNADGLRLGIWLMPDNITKGMLETFLGLFVPSAAEPLWKYAQQCCEECRSHGAPYIPAHADKALIHTWLAWQDPPGPSLHLAIIRHQLRPGSPQADKFVNWFKKLYGF